MIIKVTVFLVILITFGSSNLFARALKVKPANPKSTETIQVLDTLIQQLSKDDKNLTHCLMNLRTDKLSEIFKTSGINLNNDPFPDFILDAISNPENCLLCGARRCNQWVYMGTPQGFSMVLAVEGADEISVLKTSNNSAYDLSIVYPPGNTYSATEEIFKFNGRRYQKTNQPHTDTIFPKNVSQQLKGYRINIIYTENRKNTAIHAGERLKNKGAQVTLRETLNETGIKKFENKLFYYHQPDKDGAISIAQIVSDLEPVVPTFGGDDPTVYTEKRELSLWVISQTPKQEQKRKPRVI